MHIFPRLTFLVQTNENLSRNNHTASEEGHTAQPPPRVASEIIQTSLTLQFFVSARCSTHFNSVFPYNLL